MSQFQYNMTNEDINILGQNLILKPIDKSSLPIIYADEDLFATEINNVPVCILKIKDGKWTPKQFVNLANTLERSIRQPIVFYFSNIDRRLVYRLKENNINFIVGNATIYIPELMIAYKEQPIYKSGRLVPYAQIILLNYLLKQTQSQMTYKEIQNLTEISYLNVSRGIRSLEVCHLCKLKRLEKTIVVQFNADKAALWSSAQAYLINPIVKISFCDEIKKTDFSIGGISALAEYGDINPEYVTTFVLDKDEYKLLMSKKQIIKDNPYDGKYRIEIWKYNPKQILNGSYVDFLSLFLTLKDNADPRIQKELNKMIEKLWL